MFAFSKRSLANLEGVHVDLIKVVTRAIDITPIDFMIIEGVRTAARQKELLARGATTTLNSRHLTGHAVDIVPLDSGGDVSWHWPDYDVLAPVIKQAANELCISLEWGGDWVKFKDGPHWQLPWADYPLNESEVL